MNDPSPVGPTLASTPARLAAFAGLALLLALAWMSYRPGLTGGFLFDDYVNLEALGRFKPRSGGDALLRYLTSGTADPLGRPLSLLSFLFDAHDWPADPAPFLRTNVALHLGIGALLFGWMHQLSRSLGDATRAMPVALLGCATWLLHPLLVSTTLYPVQREAMLPAAFVIAGLWLYGHGRLRFAASEGREGTSAMVAGVVVGTGLAMACKANGLLLPLLAAVLEATVFPAAQSLPPAPRARLRLLRGLLLGIPALALAAYLGRYLGDLSVVPAGRDWTTGERLLTQGRVLLDYLVSWLVPRSVSAGLYNDAYVVSTGLATPWSTAPALVAAIALPAAAFGLRRRMPALAAAGLFFFAGHLLESTVVPLELYFEHRNYLPTLLLGWPLARALVGANVGVPLRAVLALALVALLAATTWQRAALWGDPDRLFRLWVQQSPGSPRAQATAAQLAVQAGQAGDAEAAVARAIQARPDEPQLAITWVIAGCNHRGIGAAHDTAMRNALREARTGQFLVFQAIGDWIDPAVAGECPGLTLGRLENWTAAAQANPQLTRSTTARQNALRLRARLALARGDVAGALAGFERALAERPAPAVALADAGLLAEHGTADAGLALLDNYAHLPPPPPPAAGMPRLHALVLARQDYWPQRIAALRGRLARRAGATTGEQP